MNVLAVAPARYASSRFPGKPLADIKGKSLIQRVWEIAKSVQHVDDVIVATDSAGTPRGRHFRRGRGV